MIDLSRLSDIETAESRGDRHWLDRKRDIEWLLSVFRASLEENARLREALTACCGYMRNASIGLDVGATKRITRNLLEEGYKRGNTALTPNTEEKMG